MNLIFQPWEMGSLQIRNRLVRSATDETLSTDDGAPTQRLIDVLVELATGSVGLIIAGTAYISREGRWGQNTTGIDNDGLIKPLSRLCEKVHSAGGILAAQLLHAGSTINPDIVNEKEALFGPSAMIDPVCGHPVVELSKDHILRIVEDYAKAAIRAKEAGFNAVQIKEVVKCPVISVEGWRSPLEIAKALEKIDAVSMSRPFIREPHLAHRWLKGDLSPAHCISCNKCLNLTLKSGLGCIFHKRKKPKV